MRVTGVRPEAFCLADSKFFENPTFWRPSFGALTGGNPPAMWTKAVGDVWVYYAPIGLELPDQGWKIHVSAQPARAESILHSVKEYCIDNRLSFKHLRSEPLLHAYSLKYAPRNSSGKFIAIYPAEMEELEVTLRELSQILKEEEAPYILSDLRWGPGPLFVRYGGFRTKYCYNSSGQRVMAIATPDGHLVPDERKPHFHLPAWVELPDFLVPHMQSRGVGPPPDFAYMITEALHFSNGGGVYLGAQISDKKKVVLKEARPLAGLDGQGRDAVERLEQEVWALTILKGVNGVPSVYDRFRLWEHEFLVTEYLGPRTLQQWLAVEYPFTNGFPSRQEIAEYFERSLAVVAAVEDIIERIHQCGIVFGDLHPGNIIVNDDGIVGLVDFELAQRIDEVRQGGLGCPGFYSQYASGMQKDLYALAALRLWLLIPLNSMLELAPDKLFEYCAWAADRYDLPVGYIEAIQATLQSTDRLSVETRDLAVIPSVTHEPHALCQSLCKSILASATPERTDRLFPGDPEQFMHDGVHLAHGAAGVLWTLHLAGIEVAGYLIDWLVSSVARQHHRAPGLFDGTLGIAHVLGVLGRLDEAEQLMEETRPQLASLRDFSMYSGLSGAGLVLLDQVQGTQGKLDPILDIAEKIGRHVLDQSIMTPTRSGLEGGLLRGWSGPALFFCRLYERTADRRFLEIAIKAIKLDLALCKEARGGSQQVDTDGRLMPYLEVGSAGIALTATEILKHQSIVELEEAIPKLVSALKVEFVIESQMFMGRAGLLGSLELLRRRGVSSQTDVNEHLTRLSWHTVSDNAGISFPGASLRRVSMDLATGTAGVLAAVRAATTGGPLLPFV